MVTNNRTNNQLGDPRASLLLTSEKAVFCNSDNTNDGDGGDGVDGVGGDSGDDGDDVVDTVQESLAVAPTGTLMFN